jgi:hypothetical protein
VKESSSKVSEIINLRRASKQKTRKKKAIQATENAAKHGRTKNQKKSDAESASRLKAHLDGHIRSDP